MQPKPYPLLLFPFLMTAQSNVVTLEEIHVVEEKKSKTNTIAIDLGQEEQHQASTLFDLFKNNVTLDGAKQGKKCFSILETNLASIPIF
jgi:hypothetical protein